MNRNQKEQRNIIIACLVVVALVSIFGCTSLTEFERMELRQEVHEKYSICRRAYNEANIMWVQHINHGKYTKDGWPVSTVDMRSEMAYNMCRIDL
jgi:hypothetical protein